jgi:hypothetical protein
MKRKRKAAPDRAEPSAAQIARMSGLSISRVYRLMQEGRTGAEIVAASQRHKEEFALRGLPPVLVNGHAEDGALSFSAGADSQGNVDGEIEGTRVPGTLRHIDPAIVCQALGRKFHPSALRTKC